jgi:RimJ/RimL family protein N-acetyltransferase
MPVDAVSLNNVRTLATPRLVLRRFGVGDLDAFAELNADPVVREFYKPQVLDRAASDANAQFYMAHWERHGFGRWAIEVPGVTPFAGVVGLMQTNFDAAFTPAVEIGWRLGRHYWGHGYATEAARAVIVDGFTTLGLAEVVAFTVPANLRSRAVMERLGMRHSPADDFDHPAVPAGHPLRRQVLYRISR